MKKIEVFATTSNEEIRFNTYYAQDKKGNKQPFLGILFSGNEVSLYSPEEIDEFCKLLLSKKSEIWPEVIDINKIIKDSITEVNKCFSKEYVTPTIEETIESRKKLIVMLQKDMLKEMMPFMKIIGICAAQIEMLNMKEEKK